MIKLRKGRHVKSKNMLKAQPFAPVSQVVNIREKFLKEIKGETPVNTEMIRK